MLPRLLGYSLADLRRTSFCLLLSPFLRPPASLLLIVQCLYVQLSFVHVKCIFGHTYTYISYCGVK